MSACATCSLDESARLEFEAIGQQALDGTVSWREAARTAGLSHPQGLKTHMERHVSVAPSPTESSMAEVDVLIAETIEELKAQLRVAPVEVKPFYAAAIRNLAGLMSTQPSQQHLITSLKAIHEVTGMKLEQRLMLDFARAAFPGAPKPKALPDGIVDIEVVDE